MSINHFWDKIKGNFNKIDRTLVLYSLVILGVAFSSFFLGVLSNTRYFNPSLEPQKCLNNDNREEIGDYSSISPKSSLNGSNQTKNYVASRNGKSYYPISCSGANRIKEENKIWFVNGSEAEKSGYTLSSMCK